MLQILNKRINVLYLSVYFFFFYANNFDLLNFKISIKFHLELETGYDKIAYLENANLC